MAAYRLYFVNESGKISRSIDFYGEDDQAAVREAIRLDHAQSIEIWDRSRPVGSVAPKTGTFTPAALWLKFGPQDDMPPLPES